MLVLAQAGALDLEAPIGRYLADVPAAWAQRPVLSLLRHTSGLPEYLAYTQSETVPERRDAFMRTYGGMATAFERFEQLPLAQPDELQNVICHNQFTKASDMAQHPRSKSAHT